MKTIPNLYVSGPPGNYDNWTHTNLVLDINKADLVMFTGGTDINPAIYGKKAHPETENSDHERDAKEKEDFSVAVDKGLPMVGICRGAQLLCALAGGILVQHQKHPSSHWITVEDGRSFFVTSDHHQRAFPFGMPATDFRLIGWANNLSPFSYGEDGEDMKGHKEAEIVYYPKIKALGIQSHPEWQFPATSNDDMLTLGYLRSLINQLLANKL